ncbi:unnamed protein product [Darwinula stevensoni]|uniref:Small ribosomal subunit protein uS5m n=1 Tax=Darwinula stevensoni TaxID=69355 RepID=A0A7R8XEA3_9CRUS|nr:unnamed protein product [Darwinula stevensoni]CAG0894284.1 unnamed protein product [Darwinula stevensoni]
MGTLLDSKMLSPPQVMKHQTRGTNFFNKLSAEKLWKGVTSVSNAGKKRGRGKGRSKILAKDLNRGQIIGVGKKNIIWPGLNAPIIRGRELVRQQQLPEDKERQEKLIAMRSSMGQFRPLKLAPLERGWSGTKLPGRSVGPPDPVGNYTFEGFDTKVIECKTVVNMTGNMGRRARFSVFVVTGNQKGLAGFAVGKAPNLMAAVRKAKNRAGQKLMFLDLFEGHTVYHDFYTRFGRSHLFVHKRPEGTGLVCHRAIKTTCQVIGIKNLHAKRSWAARKNVQHLIKAFFLGLLQQKTHQKMADDTGLLVVEFRPETKNFPHLIAAPSDGHVKDAQPSEVPDFDLYASDGNVEWKPKKRVPFYVKLPSWQVHLKKWERYRNLEKVIQSKSLWLVDELHVIVINAGYDI